MKRFEFNWPEFLECSHFNEAFMKTNVCVDVTKVDPVSFYKTPESTTAEPTTTPEPVNSVSQIPEPVEPVEQKPTPSEPGPGSNITFEGDIHLKNCHCVCRP